ncbi:uncharacterized protein LOC124353972 [Homalodisca vitripennis]|uniref:uncharacterized protein LOC124353972 n=1 Tax=Homalodisca vitripennis TaxID=197043 RepID=UPI001EECD1D8|nr:uncharacterized protein LOC124353972 [Homalodisca vitripennis]
MTFGRSHNLHHFQYSIERDQPLGRVSSIKDLGVTFSSDFSFNEHVDDLCRRAYRMLGFITRSTRGMTSPLVLKTLYSSFVRQLLEYASPVWSPYQLGLIEKLEAVQRKFVRMVGVRQGLLYREIPIAGLQADLLLPDLQARRCVADVLFLTRLVSGQLDCPMLLSQVDFRIPLARTRSRDLFSRRHCQRSYVFHGPLARMVRLGNGFCDRFDVFNDRAAIIRGRVLAAFQYTVE